jgi:hypothetical protein
VRAKNFADRLAEAVGRACRLWKSIWPAELLASPHIAAAATLAAADCDYFILSLGGEHLLPLAARQWLEERLPEAGVRGAVVIVLADPGEGESCLSEGVRRYLRSLCSANRVAFYSFWAMPPADDASSRFCEEADVTEWGGVSGDQGIPDPGLGRTRRHDAAPSR